MGRPCEFDRDRAVRTAMQLFLEKGYEGTSIEDLTSALNISRASLYNAFGDKHGLLLETFCCAENLGEQSRLAALDKPGPIDQVLTGFFEGLGSQKHGCFFLTLGAEMSSMDKGVRKRVRASLDLARNKFCELIEAAQARGEVKRDVDAERASAVLLGAMVSVLTLARVHPDREVTSAVINNALTAIR